MHFAIWSGPSTASMVGICESGFEIGQDAREIALDGAREFAEGFESGPVGPAQPPLQGGQVAALGRVGQGVAHAECASEDWIDLHEMAAQIELLVGARPLVAADGPEPAGQVRTLSATTSNRSWLSASSTTVT